MNKIDNIQKILNPKSIAIIGASQKENSVGFNILKNIVEYGYKGKLYAVNPKYNNIFLNTQFYKNIIDVNDSIDLAIIAVPSKSILNVIEECNKKQIHSVVILSSGFKESGKEGEKLEKELIKKLNEFKISAVGPNTIGIINTNDKIKLNATFTKNAPKQGSIALISQSGALSCGIINTMESLPIGISKMISIGNQSDLTVSDFIEYFGECEDVDQIVLYLESINEPAFFREVCQKVSKKKPIYAIKSGRSESGCKATISHTGSLAGNDSFADALLKQSGVIRKINLESVLNCCYNYSMNKNLNGNNVVVITNGMGPAIMSADKFNDYNINLCCLSNNTKIKLKEVLSPLASVENPIDLIATASVHDYKNALTILAQDDNIDVIFVIYLELNEIKSSQVAEMIEDLQEQYPHKCFVSAYITSDLEFCKTLNQSKNVPVYKYVEDAVETTATLINYNNIKKTNYHIQNTIRTKNVFIQNIINNAQNENRHILTTHESLNIIKELGIPTSPFYSSKNLQDLLLNADNLGYPIALKISSKTLTHKTDVNGVILNIQNKKALEEEFKTLYKRLQVLKEIDNIDSFIIQPMCKAKRELVIGVTRDNNYGPVLMFGQGGIFIETQKDVAFKISPLVECDIASIIEETNASKLLLEVRNMPMANKDTLIKIIKAIDNFALTYKEVREMDINPLLIDDKNGDVYAIDARIIIE